MSLNQKRAWGNIIIWGFYIIASVVIFSTNGTIFFWQENYMKTAFYIVTGIAVIGWFIMMLILWIRNSRSVINIDERDREIMSRVNAAAGPVAMTSVAVMALILMIIYLEDKNSVISPYFLMYITMANVVVYWLAQAIITLIAYRRS